MPYSISIRIYSYARIRITNLHCLYKTLHDSELEFRTSLKLSSPHVKTLTTFVIMRLAKKTCRVLANILQPGK